MCGRYALSLRPSVVREYLANQNMPAEEAPADGTETIRQSYNFAPGYHGLIYRADVPDYGAGGNPNEERNDYHAGEPSPKKAKTSHSQSKATSSAASVDGLATHEVRYKIQAAKWGLVPFWTKRPPDYGSQMRTINCRDDSLIENRGMWNTMKQRKRCIVVAEGFYEWLKKNNGKEKIPHFVRRKAGGLLCFAGLWDCVRYEGSEENLYSYTIITTDSNPQLRFLHDRMPVILEPGSKEMRAWLDPSTAGWSKELQSMLKPFKGELDCYPVDKAVGKVGNNSPQFVVPIDSKENKKNIANFFGKHRETAKDAAGKNLATRKEEEAKQAEHVPVNNDLGEDRETDAKVESTEDNAPLPRPKGEPVEELQRSMKRETWDLGDDDLLEAEKSPSMKLSRKDYTEFDDSKLLEAEKSPPTKLKCEASGIKDEELLEAETSALKKTVKAKEMSPSPTKHASAAKKTRSAISNGTVPKTPTKGRNARITAFFGR